jgi:hypothetical protein
MWPKKYFLKIEGICDTHRIQRKVKHDNMIYIQVQTPSSQVRANQCRAIFTVTLKLVEVFNPAFKRKVIQVSRNNRKWSIWSDERTSIEALALKWYHMLKCCQKQTFTYSTHPVLSNSGYSVTNFVK